MILKKLMILSYSIVFLIYIYIFYIYIKNNQNYIYIYMKKVYNNILKYIYMLN